MADNTEGGLKTCEFRGFLDSPCRGEPELVATDNQSLRSGGSDRGLVSQAVAEARRLGENRGLATR